MESCLEVCISLVSQPYFFGERRGKMHLDTIYNDQLPVPRMNAIIGLNIGKSHMECKLK